MHTNRRDLVGVCVCVGLQPASITLNKWNGFLRFAGMERFFYSAISTPMMRSITILSILFASRVCTKALNEKSTQCLHSPNCFRIHLAARCQQIGRKAYGSERDSISAANYWFLLDIFFVFVWRFFCFVLFVLSNKAAGAAADALHQSFCWRGEKYAHYVNFFRFGLRFHLSACLPGPLLLNAQ